MASPGNLLLLIIAYSSVILLAFISLASCKPPWYQQQRKLVKTLEMGLAVPAEPCGRVQVCDVLRGCG